MAEAARKQVRQHWIAQAERLDSDRYFSAYSETQREEVLRKGYIGKYSPEEGLALAKRHAKAGISVRTPQFNDNMRDCFQLVGEEVRETLLKVLAEVPPESYKPPRELRDPPGIPFQFRSKTLRCELYLKFQVGGTARKPQVVFWSCHQPVF